MKIFVLCQRVWNGSVLISSDFSAYQSRELAEKVMYTLKAKNEELSNQKIPVNLTFEIKECDFYTSINDVPILNKNNENYE